jgi:8-oxo-dGTP pyrophosphatase MutT (NUDIX family)
LNQQGGISIYPSQWKWDLPKGKTENNEREETSLREVAEETEWKTQVFLNI